jgi:hypothetical protein
MSLRPDHDRLAKDVPWAGGRRCWTCRYLAFRPVSSCMNGLPTLAWAPCKRRAIRKNSRCGAKALIPGPGFPWLLSLALGRRKMYVPGSGAKKAQRAVGRVHICSCRILWERLFVCNRTALGSRGLRVITWQQQWKLGAETFHVDQIIHHRSEDGKEDLQGKLTAAKTKAGDGSLQGHH